MRLARLIARALLGCAFVLLVAGLVVLALALVVGTWPLRRAAVDDKARARARALQELLFALAGVAVLSRRR